MSTLDSKRYKEPYGVDIVLPKPSDCGLSTGFGTEFFIDGVKLEGVQSYSIPSVCVDSVLCASLTFGVKSITYKE